MSAPVDGSVIVVGDAPEAVFEGALAKIHQQAEWQIHQAKISQNLFAMYWRQFLNRLELDHEPPLHEQIDLECVVYDNAIILQRQPDLTFDRNACLAERLRHQGLIGALKQAWAEIAVEMEATIDNASSQMLQIVLALYLRVFV
jgi:hypothetical protein